MGKHQVNLQLILLKRKQSKSLCSGTAVLALAESSQSGTYMVLSSGDLVEIHTVREQCFSSLARVTSLCSLAKTRNAYDIEVE